MNKLILYTGLRDPDLCNHSLMAEILCLYSSNAFEKIKKYENLFKYNDCGHVKNNKLEENGIYKELKDNENNVLYKNIKNNKLKININKEKLDFGALLFFSLNDGEFLSYISENVCGNSVEVLASNNNMTTIICGDDQGFVRILRNNPKFDDFEIREENSMRVCQDKIDKFAKFVRNFFESFTIVSCVFTQYIVLFIFHFLQNINDKKEYNNELMVSEQLYIEEEEEEEEDDDDGKKKIYQIKRKKTEYYKNELLKKLKTIDLCDSNYEHKQV
ncbi:hypothetical protein [Plasmodium yoelii yoelii]|uniref:Uncharacterized protein n=1 Tax=Plasmodium yoelii yoelii TaxID=73239 RepID=Q7R9T1_PLAYO|nr:hypothetical protein [Plasmodium yoelii yoelii]